MTDLSDSFAGLDLLPYDADADGGAAPPMLLTERSFPYVGAGLSAEAFAAYVQSYDFGTVPPSFIVFHHTAIPDASWAPMSTDPRTKWDRNEAGLAGLGPIYEKRRRQLDGIMRFYRDTRGWDAGPHLFIDDRWIWLMTPMADVGIHAAEGNSYRDALGHLHYSIGIEVIGYYEHVPWPAAVQRLVGSAVVSLQRRLGTFELVYRGGPTHSPARHDHSISSHRDYNKPACPGAAITEAFYIDVLRKAAAIPTEPPAPAPRAYVVKPHTSASVRAAPRKNAPLLRVIHSGDAWSGVPVKGGQASAVGYGSSKIWIRNADGACVWSGLLTEVAP